MARRAKSTVVQKQSDKHIRDDSIARFGIECIKTYATEVNLDRAVPDIFDGFKPVQRRVLWEMSHFKRGEMVKTARVVGGALSRWHPHGDATVSGSIETLVHQNTPLVQGTGNWGGLLDSAAAMRYTLCSLSNFGWSCFDTDYLAVTDFVPNYDGKDKEPVSLPVSLPIVLLNGSDGIGVGVTTKLPTFTAESVVKVLTDLFSGKKLSYEYMASTLKPALKWGGRFINTSANKAQWLELMKTGRAQISYDSPLEVDTDHKRIIISEWPPGLNPDKFISKVRTLTECARAYNSKGSTTFTIECRRECNVAQFQEFAKKVQQLTVVRQSYRINVTERVAKIEDGITSFSTEFLSLGVAELLVRWARARLKLEDRYLLNLISKQSNAIQRSRLLIYACNHLKVIFDSLRTENPESYLVEQLQLTLEQAKQILELKVRQLSKLDFTELKQRLKDQMAVLKELKGRRKDPKPEIIKSLVDTLDKVRKDRQVEMKRKTASFSVH